MGTDKDIVDVDKLSNLEMTYHLLKLKGKTIVGDPKVAFAFFDNKENKIEIYTSCNTRYRVFPCAQDFLMAALDIAKENNANLFVSDEMAWCVIKNVSAKGVTYEEAAMRALLKYELSKQ